MEILDTLKPYRIIEHKGIEYTVCASYDHISRYQCLRQVVHSPADLEERFVDLEVANPFETHTEIQFYDVPLTEENRLDIIAQKFLGSARYAWVIAYLNQIEDGFTVREGQRIKIPKSITAFFNKGEILASVNPFSMNLGSE